MKILGALLYNYALSQDVFVPIHSWNNCFTQDRILAFLQATQVARQITQMLW